MRHVGEVSAACNGSILAFTIEGKNTVHPPPVGVALVTLQRPFRSPVSFVQFIVFIYVGRTAPSPEAPPAWRNTSMNIVRVPWGISGHRALPDSRLYRDVMDALDLNP